MTTENENSYEVSTLLQALPSEPQQPPGSIIGSVLDVISFFEAEKCPQVLLTGARNLLQIFYQRWTSISLKESEELYYFLIKILKEKAQQYVSCPKLLAHLILLLCEIIKTNYSELGFTTRVFDHILTFFHEDPQANLSDLDLLKDLLQHMQINEGQENPAIDNGDCKTLDNTSIGLAIFIKLVENMDIEEEDVSGRNRPFRRNIKNFQKNCLPRIITFTFQQIQKEFKMLNKGQTFWEPEKEIKPALFRLLAKCLKASHLVEFIKASEDSFHQLLPNNQFRPISLITHQIINGLIKNYFQNLDVIKFLFKIYGEALEYRLQLSSLTFLERVKASESCNNILQILTSLLTINSSLSTSASNQEEYIQTLVEGINSIFSETTRKAESEELLLSLASLISDINLKSSDFFLCKSQNEKWFELLYEATTCLIDKMPKETTLIHSFLEIWDSFAQANDYIIEKSQEFSNYLSRISHLYLRSRADLCGVNQQQQPETIVNPVDFTRGFFIANAKYGGKLIIYNDEMCKFLANEFQSLQLNLNEISLESAEAMRFIWLIYVFSDMIHSSKKSQLNKYAAKKWEFVCATIKFIFGQSKADNTSPLYQSKIFAEAKIHFLNQFILNYCLDKHFTENAQNTSQMASDLNFACYNDLLVSLLNEILMGLEDASLCPEIIKVLEQLVNSLNCCWDHHARQIFLRIGKTQILTNAFCLLFQMHLENHFEYIPLISKLRSPLYRALSKILDLVNFCEYCLVDKILIQSLGVSNERDTVATFMSSFEARSHRIFQLLQEDVNSIVNLEEQCVTLIHDLTSSLCYIESEAKYLGFMQQILQIGFFQVIEKILQTTSENSEINLAILNFIGELIENKGSRLPKSSSDIRSVLISFALKVTRHIGQNTNIEPITSQRVFKVIPFIAKVLTNIQTAKLIDLGNIRLTYLEDLQSLCEVLFVLLKNCPLEIIVAFPETPAKYIYSFLEIVAQKKLAYFGQIPHEIWRKILEILHFGIQSVDLPIAINSYETISQICHQMIGSKSQDQNEIQLQFGNLFQYMSADSQKIQNILRTCFITILNGEVSNYSYISKMIKGLSVVENEYFKSLGHELGTFYGQENQYQLMEHFNQLVRVNLSVHGRENFRGRLENFARNVASFQ